ncbi:MarR family transcriptional regulator [Candidatus Filomicrobium marinum]|uniref:MarR family transcriptional regulator n=2 Tax=Filomicrobium TaxID=119044 RepID=A0A0D6JBH5_9HYPH|nr:MULTISPECIES: MarR family winged helix-turn-helix transcriptional regulator [Filomicrobium]MCV0368579.1 MarR family winged helix-turn-helix transcriptional regulator [Filomicrobium sp.]CFX01419.1 MarR family transcriptional regulator [Candidatus Filomicrobium marinum]CPR15439.1 MarR family transcriptional regulator [Candidatus Filomicrobium marinum]SDO65160.1 transcriptional regulator, MarR family [Filomicrobium insigne]
MKARTNIEGGNSSALHLLHRAGQCADELFALNIGESELTPRQFEVLRAVASHAEPSQTVLVEHTGIDRSTLADIVRRLVARGLLVRKRTRHDARMYAVRLTPAGENALKNAQPAVHSTNDAILQALPNAERKEFLNALNRIIELVSGATHPRPAK